MTDHRYSMRASSVSSKGLTFISSASGDRVTTPKTDLKNELLQRYHPDNNSWIMRRPIKFCPVLASRIKGYLSSVIHKNLLFEIVPSDISDIVGHELKRFMCAIQAYKESRNPVIPLHDLIEGISDIKFASRLKKIRDKSFRVRWNFNCFKVDPDLEDIPQYNITDIGDIFNYNYWFFWEEDLSEVDDLAWGNEPVGKISEHDIKEFKDMLNHILPSHVDEVSREEILIQTSGSVCHDPKGKRVYEVKEKENTFSKEPLSGRRSKIAVSPDNIRDIIILPVSQSNSVKWIEAQTRLIVEDMQFSAYVRNQEEFNQRIEEFYEGSLYFVDRDIKKEGITKPRELLKITLEVLKEKYPHMRCYDYASIYDSLEVIDLDGRTIYPKRGHGLGMANALTTLIQITLFQMTKEELCLEYGKDAQQIRCVVYNDDFSASFPNEDLAEEYWSIEDSILQRYFVIRNEKKSYLGRNSFSFCETYFPQILNRKDSYRRYEFYQAFAMPNISVAKMLVNNLSRIRPPFDFDEFIAKLVKFYGFEFYEGEWENPYLLGGWVTPSINNVNTSLLYGGVYTFEKARAFLSVINSDLLSPKYRSGGRDYVSPIESVFLRHDLFIPEELNVFYNYKVPINKVRALYSLRNDDIALNKLYYNFSMSRFEIYQSLTDSGLPKFGEMFHILMNKFPDRDFLPPEEILIDRKIKTKFKDDDYIHPRVPNPLLSCLKFFNKDKISDEIIPCVSSLQGRMFSKYKLTDAGYLSQSLFKDHEDGIIESVYRIEDADIEGGNPCSYINPIAVLNANFWLRKRLSYPFVHGEFPDRKGDYDNFEVDRILSSKKRMFLFKTFRPHWGVKKSIDVIIENEDNIDLLVEEFLREPEEEPQREIEMEPEEPIVFKYHLSDYREWVNTNPSFPGYNSFEWAYIFWNTYSIQMDKKIYGVMQGEQYGADGFEMDDQTLEFIEVNIHLFRLMGLSVTKVRPKYYSFSWPDEDSGSEESSMVMGDDDFDF